MWKELLESLTDGKEYVKLNQPATQADISAVEKELDVILPSALKRLLLEFNGDNNFLFSTAQIIETNLMMRGLNCFMPLDCLLFFAGNGCGDYYGYPITREGIRDWDVYMWEHETDSRISVASGLKDTIVKYYTDKI